MIIGKLTCFNVILDLLSRKPLQCVEVWKSGGRSICDALDAQARAHGFDLFNWGICFVGCLLLCVLLTLTFSETGCIAIGEFFILNFEKGEVTEFEKLGSNGEVACSTQFNIALIISIVLISNNFDRISSEACLLDLFRLRLSLYASNPANFIVVL